SYLEKYPELGPGSELPAKLVYEEYRIRHLYGDKPNLEKYRNRFPVQFTELEQFLREAPVETLSFAVDQAPSANQDTRVVPVEATPVQSRPSQTAKPGTTTANVNNLMLQLGGAYVLNKRIGSGSYGEVWKAEARGGVEVAVKVITRPIEQ